MTDDPKDEGLFGFFWNIYHYLIWPIVHLPDYWPILVASFLSNFIVASLANIITKYELGLDGVLWFTLGMGGSATVLLDFIYFSGVELTTFMMSSNKI